MKTKIILSILFSCFLLSGCSDNKQKDLNKESINHSVILDSEGNYSYVFGRENSIKSDTILIPYKPLIIIEITSHEQGLANYVYKYKMIDKNGYVFYQTESAKFGEKPRLLVGDTLK